MAYIAGNAFTRNQEITITEIVIASAARTPVGSFGGGFSSLPAHELGRVAIEGALTRAGVEAAEVNEVIMGQILQAGEGQNPARQASIAAGSSAILGGAWVDSSPYWIKQVWFAEI